MELTGVALHMANRAHIAVERDIAGLVHRYVDWWVVRGIRLAPYPDLHLAPVRRGYGLNGFLQTSNPS